MLKIFPFNVDEMDSSLMASKDSTPLLCVSLDDYEILPKHMKSLASWEVKFLRVLFCLLLLLAKVVKQRSYLE